MATPPAETAPSQPAASDGTAGPLAPVGIYLHVPFCVSLCPYCDFVVYTGAAARGPRARMASFVRAVTVELELRADLADDAFGPPTQGSMSGAKARLRPGPRPPLASVYLGGGTPSLLAARDVGELIVRIERRFGLAPEAEITIEANPGSDERGDLVGFRAAGVTRVSFGAQSLDPAELRRLGRRHRPDDVVDAVHAAERAGIAHRSVDLLYDVPGQAMQTWRRSVERVLELPIDHLSAYALTLDDPDAAGLTGGLGDHLPVRPGARRWRKGARSEQDDELAADAYLWLDDRLAAAGFTWYEISNWTRAGGASRHNQAYWRRQPTLGVGPGAHAFDGARRRSWNAARLDAYLAALLPTHGSPPRLPPGADETLDDDAIRLERFSLGLRLAEGIAAADFEPAARLEAIEAEDAGLLEPAEEGRWRATPRGRLLAGELAARLAG